MWDRFRKSFFDILEDFFSQSQILMVNNEKYVWKNYSHQPGIFKWLLINIANIPVKVYPFALDPRDRMERETRFLRENKQKFLIPRLFLVDWINYTIVREYIDGEPFDPKSHVEKMSEIARIIGQIHRSGYVMGDTKYYNFLIGKDNKIYVIDAEQAIKTDNPYYQLWDIILFFITTTYRLMSIDLLVKKNQYRQNVGMFIENYLEENPELKNHIQNILDKSNYKLVIYMLLPIPYSTILVNVLQNR